MSEEGRKEGGFFNRWSRLKTHAREADPAPPAGAAVPAPVAAASDEPPELPPVESLSIDSDFRGFLHPKVDEDLRRSALRKLFSDPHFNVMDGLDVYIDDYSVSEPIPPEMLAGMKQAQRILRWAEGRDDDEADEDGEAAASQTEGDPAEGAPAPALEQASSEPSAAVAQPTGDPLPQAIAKPD